VAFKKEQLERAVKTMLSKYHDLSLELKYIAGRVFCKRKIIVISDNGISSVPVSSKSQGFFAIGLLFIFLWISFSTGKYVTYENVISKKDREIWNTNITNEGLQYQMADLHQNLSDINKYFENMRQLDQSSEDNDLDKTSKQDRIASSNKKTVAENEAVSSEGVQQILSNIREQVIARIDSLENIIQMTGINLKKIADQDILLKGAMIDASHLYEQKLAKSDSNQGGPYYPIDDATDSLFTQSEFESEINYLMQLEKVVKAMPLASPLKKYIVTSSYGRRNDPIKGTAALHSGIDLAGAYKSKVYSPAPGVITYARVSGSYGRFIQIDHGFGITTRYGHLNRILVKSGDTVKEGQLIGLQGNTGRSTGSHVHYEVRLNNRPINPAKFLKVGKNVF
jgi:murein DD-endopeptidase MepM/ murein hydrolase activator NlpD